MRTYPNHTPFLYFIIPPLIVASIIFYLSCLITPTNLPEIKLDWIIGVDKIVHFIMYFGLAFIIGSNYILLKKGKIIYLRLYFFSILIPVIYGGMIELLQEIYFSRSAEWGDFFANSLGALVGTISSLFIKKFFTKRKYRIY